LPIRPEFAILRPFRVGHPGNSPVYLANKTPLRQSQSMLSATEMGYVLSGLLVGLLVGQTGVGGGSLMTPLLVLVFGIHPATAVGTDLLYASVTKTVGSTVHGYNKTVDWWIVVRLAAGSLPATAATLFLVSKFNLVSPGASTVLSVMLGAALIISSLSLLARDWILSHLGSIIAALSPGRVAALTMAAGAALGVAVSLTSVGAAAIGVVALIALYPRLPTRTIVGSDIAHAVPLTLLAGIGHFIMGSVDVHLLGTLLIGSIPGVLIGSLLAARLPEWVIRPLLAIVLAIVGVKLVI
jgi:uncharacterized membrane protein YfcA